MRSLAREHGPPAEVVYAELFAAGRRPDCAIGRVRRGLPAARFRPRVLGPEGAHGL
ncbi:hypothetical protein ACRAWF_23010 [Streptomyces sp. L7]